MSKESESLSLDELQDEKSALEVKAHRLRDSLRKLATGRPPGWRAEFATRQSELIEVATAIGRLDKRICALVEGSIGPAKEDSRDV